MISIIVLDCEGLCEFIFSTATATEGVNVKIFGLWIYCHNYYTCAISLSMTITRQTLYNHISKMQWKVQCSDSVSCFKVGVRNK